MTDLIESQLAYYRARAHEYDEWFLRQGRYDRGPELNRRWFAETAEVRGWLSARGNLGDVLELAAGTGLWTEALLAQSRSIHCVDGSPEVIEINRARLAGKGNTTYEIADIFHWQSPRRFDTVFFSFWLSHVPDGEFERFWNLVGQALAPKGKVIVVDSLADVTSTAVDQSIERSGEVTRRLNDGREFRIVKQFWEPEALADRLSKSGWKAELHATATYFLYGSVLRHR